MQREVTGGRVGGDLLAMRDVVPGVVGDWRAASVQRRRGSESLVALNSPPWVTIVCY